LVAPRYPEPKKKQGFWYCGRYQVLLNINFWSLVRRRNLSNLEVALHDGVALDALVDVDGGGGVEGNGRGDLGGDGAVAHPVHNNGNAATAAKLADRSLGVSVDSLGRGKVERPDRADGGGARGISSRGGGGGGDEEGENGNDGGLHFDFLG